MEIMKCLYDRYILGQPGIVILILLSIFVFLGYQIRYFRLDASADSLILEHDEDLRYYRMINDRYETSDYLLMTYTSERDIFSDDNLTKIKQLRDELAQLDQISSVVTILDVPLLSTPPVPIKNIRQNIKTLESQHVNKAMARAEIGSSPIYQELLVSKDMLSSAFQINLVRDMRFQTLSKQRNRLIDKKLEGSISSKEWSELKRVSYEYFEHRDRLNKKRHEVINAIRKIMDKYRSSAALFLGGIPMISDDMIRFVSNDIKIFGIGIFCFLVLTLAVIFRKVRWVILTMLCCAFSVVAMTGLVSIFGWQVTVISSNFISLQLVITMSITIHLIVRYNELLAEYPNADHKRLVLETVHSILKPCIYTTLTTIAGFSSLLICDILPVINFGWMMTIGLIVSLFVAFLLFPAGLMLLNKEKVKNKREFGHKLTSFFAVFTKEHGYAIYAFTLIIILITFAGVSNLAVENSFIDYFRDSTEIYKGMKMIDRKLGGTTPLDVIIDFESSSDMNTEPISISDDDMDMFDDFEEFDDAEHTDKYWFTPDKLELIGNAHDYLDGFHEIGKILSLHTMMKVIENLNDNKSLDNFGMSLLLNEIPEEFKEKIVYPYVSVKNNQARITMRIKDSIKSLKRDSLLKKIRSGLINRLKLKPVQIHLAGIMVLYNNMLQSLFNSQIRTIGFTILALMLMFLLLFRSFKISFIALFPNILSSMAVLGVMGLSNIPLDIMTITIAAISIGIAVDDTIHYIYRFKHEFETDRNYIASMLRCHKSIGNAMYYTSITIVIGFSILVLSNFIPSVLFGLLTGLAMIIALIASLTLLPRLIILFEPFGPNIKIQESLL